MLAPHVSATPLPGTGVRYDPTAKDNRRLSEMRMLSRTGASVATVPRRMATIPSPGPGFRLAGGETLIVPRPRHGVRVRDAHGGFPGDARAGSGA
ncbi:hypothetical protein [Streptomyces sp. AV19]|uniref:hypothetical protein n=1 Tax=Streptomyces sp. AV19 TaxID=2793068 RepID=UPI002413AB5C|nr:hypothetical protein [Streptomyces sp. AV19]MDG4536638.1 hypothetical protein [Streptomyces sp. AV19]